MTFDLFADEMTSAQRREDLCPGALVLRGFALPCATVVFGAVHDISQRAPFRHMVTPGGLPMSVAMTNCGTYGWVTDRAGYRYTGADPVTGQPWPRLPVALQRLASDAATAAGYPDFIADACLINRYHPGARLSLHQDNNERDFGAPIVSVSLGVPAVFLFGGARRRDRPQHISLLHGDVVVWGGPARLNYHGVLPIVAGAHAMTGRQRINLTLRKVAE